MSYDFKLVRGPGSMCTWNAMQWNPCFKIRDTGWYGFAHLMMIYTIFPSLSMEIFVKVLYSTVVPGHLFMISSNGSIFRITGPLWGESTGHRWILLTKASEVELWCFLWSVPEQTVEQPNRDTGDLRRRHAHYDVTVIL